MTLEHVADDVRELTKRFENLERRCKEHDERFDLERCRTADRFDGAARRGSIALSLAVGSHFLILGILIYLGLIR